MTWSAVDGGHVRGLAICREIANAHHGRVWVKSEEGEGSAFSLAVPGAADQARSRFSSSPGGVGTVTWPARERLAERFSAAR
jgi:hypothetical protein